jgi:hypothetical protein
LLYFFNAKSVLTTAQFETFRVYLQDQQTQRNLCELLKMMLEDREKIVSKGKKADGETYLELV